MFVHFAASVAVTAVRNLARLCREEILVFYLKQPKDKKINASIQATHLSKKFTNMLGDYEMEICVYIGEVGERGHQAHLGDSGLLIGGDTQLLAIHHRPLRPLDNS